MSRWLSYLTLLAVALFLTQSLLRPETLCTDDGFYHINKAVVLEAALRQGHLLPRWQPEMAWGFGYPHFNYYAPLGSYLLVALHQTGLIYPAALHLLMILAVWLAGAGAYWLGREWWGEAGGLVTGLAYQSAPYLAFNVIFRGALAETLGLALMPLVLFTFHRALAPRPAGRALITRWDLAAAGALAGLLYAHNATALGVAPLAAAYAGLLALKQRAPGMLVRGGLLFAAGLALAARFWLPALAERGLVQSDRLLVPPIFTYYTNYLTPGELLAPPLTEDPLLINPSPAKGLGLLAVALAGLGAFAGLRRRAAGLAWPSLFFLGALAAYAALTLAVTQPVWEAVPLIAFLQFPWRLLGAGALCAALLIGGNVLWLPKRAGAVTAGLLLALALGQLGWWYPRYCEPMSEITLARTVDYEYATGTIGSTAKGEFLPQTVRRFPEDRSVAEALIADETPAYLAGLPAAAGLAVLNAYPLDYTAALTLTAPARLTFKQFAFPGWTATLDGAPLALTPDPEWGLITFTVPAGAHTVRFSFGETPLRLAADAISLLAVLALLGLLPFTASAAALSPAAASAAALSPAWAAGLLALAVALNAARPLVLERYPNPLIHTAFEPAPGAVATAQQALALDLTGGLRVHGYDLAAARLPADGAVDVAVYLSAAAPVDRIYRPTFRVRDAAGLQWNDNDNALPPRWHREPPPTFAWAPGQYAQWARHLTLLPGTPPGEYQLWAEVFDLNSLEIQSVLDAQGNAVAPQFTLGTVTVDRPARPFSLAPEAAARARFGPLTFLGYGLERAGVNAGETLALTGYWRAETAPGADRTARLELLDAAGQAAAAWEVEPVNGYGAARWQAGDEWRGQYRLVIPADLPGGAYQLAVSVAGEAGRQSLTTVTVTAPERVFTAPAFAQASGAQFAGVGAVAGYTLERAGAQLTLTLVWQAAATSAQNYWVFVHFGAGDRVVAQSASAPAAGARPTASWVAGEYIQETRPLTLPADLAAGSYQLRVGLFDPQTGERVPASGPGAEGDQRVLIASVTIP